MPGHFLKDLGWDTRRLRVLLRLADWAYLDAKASEWNGDAASLIGSLVGEAIYQRRLNERVDLTPKGEAAADEPKGDLDHAKWAKGGSEWQR
jgi:hypothetical protein